MTQQVIPLFVIFKTKAPEGFKMNFSYPVYAIDIIDLEEGQSVQTNFLLSGHDGQFTWVDSIEVARHIPNKYRTKSG